MEEPVSCKYCKYRKRCRKHGISKGSRVCQENLGLIEKKEEVKGVSDRAKTTAILWAIYNNSKRQKENQ